MNHTLHNFLAVARREYTWRARTRTFVVSTIILALAGVILALAPVAISYFDKHSSQHIGVFVAASDLRADAPAVIEAMLNAPAEGTTSADQPTKDFEASIVSNLDDGRRSIGSGSLNGLLAISREAAGSLTFTYYTGDPASTRTPQLIRQASNSIAIQDRLAHAGIDPTQQASLFAPATYEIANADPVKQAEEAAKPEGQSGLNQDIANMAVGAALTIFIFMAIILYGTWVAMSVVEEKNSRVMEVILGAATPFELLAGKVIGVGAVALTQYVAVFIPAVVAILVQGEVASLVMGEPASSISLPSGLTVPVLLAFSVFFLLGFALYAVLFAAAGSLVSRQEDVNQVVMPMTLVSAVGYFVSVYAATGLFDLKAGWVIVLSHIPFLSPYLMVTRIAAGQVQPWEPLIDVVLLVLTIVACVWIAARIYSAGVLMYGQRPGLRPLMRALRAQR